MTSPSNARQQLMKASYTSLQKSDYSSDKESGYNEQYHKI